MKRNTAKEKIKENKRFPYRKSDTKSLPLHRRKDESVVLGRKGDNK
jgi:hypothetical protein